MSRLELKHTRRGKSRYENETERENRSWRIGKGSVLVSCVSVTRGVHAVDVGGAFWAADPGDMVGF